MKLITSEITQWRNKGGRDYFTKTKEKRHVRGGLVIVGELKNTSRCFLSFVSPSLHLFIYLFWLSP